MRNSLTSLLVALLLISSAAAAQVQPRLETGFLDRSVSLGGQAYKYQIFVPPAYTPSQRWPVIPKSVSGLEE